MSFLTVKNVRIAGVSACVPEQIEENSTFHLFSKEEGEKFIATTGVERHHIADKEVTTADLCIKAGNKLLEDLKWDKDEIDCIIFVSQTADYILPATSCIVQERMGLSQACYSLDISLGCSGWVYGLSVISSLLGNGTMKKGLLLVGDTITKICSPNDKSTYPLFGDCGTVTALEFNKNAEDLKFTFNTDGIEKETIIVKDGGYRNPFSVNSLITHSFGEGIEHNDTQLVLDGMDVFAFGISKAPSSVKELSEKFDIDLDEVDFFEFHQANMMMNEKIRKKLKLPAEKMLYSLRDFGNTSSASIPLSIVTDKPHEIRNDRHTHIACGFGVGLSWASCYFSTDNIVIPELIIY